MPALDVRKTYKLYIGGRFVRTESGRSYLTKNQADNFPRSTRKDLRNAVVAARAAFPAWSNATAFNRGQVLYRIAEMLHSRSQEFADLLPGKNALAEVEASVAALIWYAGWSDKLAAVVGTVNPVAGPYFSFTLPEPTGLVGLVCPEHEPLLSLVHSLAAILCSGNTAVVVLPEQAPLVGLVLAEVLAVSDLPAGVVNLLSGTHQELLPTLASHMDVNALDSSGCSQTELIALQEAASNSVKRVASTTDRLSLQNLTNFIELKTVWHPLGV